MLVRSRVRSWTVAGSHHAVVMETAVKMFGITKRGSIQGIVPVIEYMSMCCPGFSEHLY